MIGRNTVVVFCKAGNGLFLDLGVVYMGVCLYRLCQPCRYVLYTLLYLRFEKCFLQKEKYVK